jgi:chorismate mutase
MIGYTIDNRLRKFHKKMIQIKPLEEWGIGKVSQPLLIAGPCSAETEEQVLDTARQLAANGVKIFRAGIWKPRTRPGTFEGIGAEGLQWLKRVKEETGMLISTEVANPNHVLEVLKAGIDMVWVGARTSVNPFATQEIAEALRGVDIPVIVKNPINPDVDLWYGAIERFYKVGIKKLAALHRGFSGIEKSKLRNEPHWQLLLDLRRRLPNLPLICDPSHMAGCREFIPEISQKAYDLNMQGLMIESHNNPDVALSDSKQQLTPNDLKDLVSKLIIRDITSADKSFQDQLTELRSEIDEYDDQLIALLANRMEVADKIGKVKKANNVTILQSGRWESILKKVHEKGSLYSLSDNFLDKIFKAIHDESIDRQEEILNK